jgi:sulfatase modifying factor 1
MKSLKYLALLILIIPLLFSCSTSTTEPNQVVTPVITPGGGTYTTAQILSVTITCATVGAEIYYTTDGTTPDSTSMVYTTPISVKANKTIKAVAMKDEMDDSPIASATYVFDYMVNVTGGTFNMGRTVGTSTYADELPVHPVTVSDFMISKYEVTQAEWYAIMGNNPSEFVGDLLPVEMVRWYEVLKYCNLRSMAEGLTPAYTINGSTDPIAWGVIPSDNSAIWNAVICNWSANGYRLPTEAEWEYAARGAVTSPDFIYSGSNTVGEVSWYDINAGDMTHQVGGKTANGLGCFDMSGNVQEWVWDWYGSDYYNTLSTTTPTVNPLGPTTNADNRKVIRGGSWFQTSQASRVAFRNWGNTDNSVPTKVKDSYLGFRLVRSSM